MLSLGMKKNQRKTLKMTTTKVICNFVLQGSTILPLSECENSKHPNKSKDFSHKSIRLTNINNKKPVFIDYYVRNCKEAIKTLNISDIGYDWMVSFDSYFEVNSSKSDWKKMSEKERLKAHLTKVAHDFHATSFSFEILPD